MPDFPQLSPYLHRMMCTGVGIKSFEGTIARSSHLQEQGVCYLYPLLSIFFSVGNNFIPSHIILWCMHGTCFLYECPPTVPLLEGQSWLLAQNLSLSLFFFILSRFFATRLDHFQLQYSGKLSREKTFKNFADLGPPAEVFSMKLGMCYTR